MTTDSETPLGKWGDVRRNPRTGQVAVHTLVQPGSTSAPWVTLAVGLYTKDDAHVLRREHELERPKTVLTDEHVADWQHEGNVETLLKREPLPKDHERMKLMESFFENFPAGFWSETSEDAH